MAENENRSRRAGGSGFTAGAGGFGYPPSEMPVYEPARPVRRVGTLTMGLALVVVGAALCVGLFFPNVDFLLLFKPVAVGTGGAGLRGDLRGVHSQRHAAEI